jgi:hypothetical protein
VCGWLMALGAVRDEWRYSTRASGAQCAKQAGVSRVQRWCAGSWDVGRHY